MALATGMVIDGKYRIIDEIGKGSMGNVYRATVERSGKIWAVKEVRNDIVPRNEEEEEMLKIHEDCLHKEIETLRSLNGSAVPPHLRSKIPSIADVIEEKDGSLIIVMDFIEGESLKKVLGKKGAVSEERVIRWTKQLCEILSFLHSKEIVYRDVKPENIMYQKETDEVAIIDFGTASTYQRLVDGTTALGSPGYNAPEQCDPRQTDARTDIYCLGRTMYSLLTGIDLGLRKNQAIDTSDLKERNPAVSSALCRIIAKCTQTSKDNRYQSCEKLLYALETIKTDRKKDIAKMCVFISCFAVSIVSAVCGYLFSLQAKALATDNYQEILDDASITSDYDEKISLYEKAIDVPDKAGEEDAYLALIQAYKTNDGDNPVFSEEESAQITKLILKNRTALEANEDGYIEVCYEMGKLFWYYYYDENQVTRAKYALDWFQIVTSKADESYANFGLAEVYKNIGIFYRDIISNVNEANDSGMYNELLLNIQNLMDKVATNQNESEIVRLELLEMARNALHQYATKFKKDGVDEDRLISLYKRIDTVLATIDVIKDENDKAYIKKSEIKSKMQDTETAIHTAYGTTRKETS